MHPGTCKKTLSFLCSFLSFTFLRLVQLFDSSQNSSTLTAFLHYFVAGIEFESLTHKTTESIKSSWDSGLGIDFN